MRNTKHSQVLWNTFSASEPLEISSLFTWSPRLFIRLCTHSRLFTILKTLLWEDLVSKTTIWPTGTNTQLFLQPLFCLLNQRWFPQWFLIRTSLPCVWELSPSCCSSFHFSFIFIWRPKFSSSRALCCSIICAYRFSLPSSSHPLWTFCWMPIWISQRELPWILSFISDLLSWPWSSTSLSLQSQSITSTTLSNLWVNITSSTWCSPSSYARLFACLQFWQPESPKSKQKKINKYYNNLSFLFLIFWFCYWIEKTFFIMIFEYEENESWKLIESF